MPKRENLFSTSNPAVAGAIRTWRSTPTLPHSITPRGRIRGRIPDRRGPAFQRRITRSGPCGEI